MTMDNKRLGVSNMIKFKKTFYYKYRGTIAAP